jgi:hypothetical protein
MLAGVSNFQDMGRVTMMGDLNDPIYAYFNPSIAYDGKGKLRINIRACTFRVEPKGNYDYRDGSNYSKTKNLYGYLDPKTLAVTKLKEVTYSADTPAEIRTIAGLEDARLFWREDGMHFIGAQVDTRREYRYPPQQAEFLYDEATNELKYLRTMFGESPARGEKNWLPPDVPSDLFEFNYSPTQVIKNGKLEGVRYGGFIHGSSQLLWQAKTKTYIAVLHSKHADPLLVGKIYDKMMYVHYIAEYNPEGYLIRLSEPFTFGLADNIEFVNGMVEHGDDLLMTLGAGDARWGIARVNKERAIKLLKPYGALEREPIKPLTRPMHKYITFQQLEDRRTARR